MIISIRPWRAPALGLILLTLGGCANFSWLPLSLRMDAAPERASARQTAGLAQALLRVADMAAAHNDWRTAASHYRRAAVLSPDDPRPLARLGTVLAAWGRPAESETAYLAALKRDPTAAAAMKGLARLHDKKSPKKLASDIRGQDKNDEFQLEGAPFSRVVRASFLPPKAARRGDGPARPALRSSPALRFPPVTAADLAGFDDRPPETLPSMKTKSGGNDRGTRSVPAKGTGSALSPRAAVDPPRSPSYRVKIGAFQRL